MHRITSLLVAAALSAGTAQAETAWQPIERVAPYAVTGRSGIELYRSIGEHGPVIGKEVRAIAHTNFKLTWTRRYAADSEGNCRIVVARPKLIITYTLPKPSHGLDPDLQHRWDVFIQGVRTHEEQHGRMILDMVKEIERVSLALSVPEDPGCAKARAALQERLGEISKAQRQRSADFDAVEMAEGGNVQRLVLQLVNGDRSSQENRPAKP